jgi:hypothetical protein
MYKTDKKRVHTTLHCGYSEYKNLSEEFLKAEIFPEDEIVSML